MSVRLVDATITRKRSINDLDNEPDSVDPEATINRDRQTLQDAIHKIDTDRADEIDVQDVAKSPGMRHLVVPKEVAETVDGLTNALDSKVVRAFSIAIREKPARIMLGAFNIPWLVSQFVSSPILAGLGGALNPMDIVGAIKFDRRLKREDPAAHAAWEAQIGITHGHGQWQDQTHLGDFKGDGKLHEIAAFWRAYKQSAVGRRLHSANPFDAMFRLDEAQSNFWRRTVFHNRARKNAYQVMDQAWQGADVAMERFFNRMTGSAVKTSEDQFRLMADAGPEMLDAANHVNRFLGNYTKFSSHERLLLSRNIVFYGWLRHSIRLTLHTMPILHPVTANIIANIGRLGADEIKDLLGVPQDTTLAMSQLIKMYTGEADGRYDTEAKDLKEIAGPAKVSPFLNIVTQLERPQQALGLVSPMVMILADNALNQSLYTGREWRIKGKSTPPSSQRPSNYFGSHLSLLNPADYAIPGLTEGKPRNRILQRGIMKTAFPFRFAEEAGVPPLGIEKTPVSTSDDTLPWDQRPIKYSKEGEAYAPIQKARREQEAIPFKQDAYRTLLPVFEEPSAADQFAQRELEKRKPAKKKKPKKKAANYGSGGYGSGGYKSGGSSSGGYTWGSYKAGGG